MLPLLLIFFLAGAPLLTKFLVGMFSPKVSNTSAKKVDESSKKENKNTTSVNTSVTKDAPKVVDQKPKPVEKPSAVIEKVTPIVAETKQTEVVIEKVTPIVEVKKEEPVVVVPTIVEKEENSANELVEETVQEETIVETVQETIVEPVFETKEETVVETVSESNEVVVEEPVVETVQKQEETIAESVQETKPVVATSESSSDEREFVSNLDVEKSSFIIKPSHISKYLIGQKGATINKIKEETQSKIDMSPIDDESTSVTISANGEGFDLEKTYLRLRDELKGYGWEFDKNENQFVEHLTESMKLFKELEKKIQEQAQIMATSFEKSKKAFEEGDKALASQLSTDGKHAQTLMKQYQEESANVMYNHLNKDRPETEIDLHGQYLDAAMNFLTQRIEKLRSQSINQLTIIYGAGNHSDASGPKIKPAVLNYLKENNLTYEEQTQGSILATI